MPVLQAHIASLQLIESHAVGPVYKKRRRLRQHGRNGGDTQVCYYHMIIICYYSYSYGHYSVTTTTTTTTTLCLKKSSHLLTLCNFVKS